MTMQKRFSALIGIAVLSMATTAANALIDERDAREQAGAAVRAQLSLNAEQFLRVQRDEKLEQLLAEATSMPSGPDFIYRASQAGDEIKVNTVVHHIFMDIDPTYIIAVSQVDRTTYRIQGFSDSMTEFEKLMMAPKTRISDPDQAEAVAEFYEAVNPQRRSMARIVSLIDLKQAAERQCQTNPFDVGEAAFSVWWKRAKPRYADLQFKRTATPQDSGYIVEWIVLSSAGPGLCGGAPLRAHLKISSDGRVGEITFAPLHGAGRVPHP
jgi:hypothetical protein